MVMGDGADAAAGGGAREAVDATGEAAAAAAVRAGLNTVVVTPTASGKTLCYNLPILNAVIENPDTRALYLFPTKALAQDQLAELQNLSARLDHRFGFGPPVGSSSVALSASISKSA